jgi:hypothetical protein
VELCFRLCHAIGTRFCWGEICEDPASAVPTVDNRGDLYNVSRANVLRQERQVCDTSLQDLNVRCVVLREAMACKAVLRNF